MKKIRKKRSVAIDTVPLPEKTVKGVIVTEGKEIVLKIGRQKLTIPRGPLSSQQQLSQLVNKNVAVVFSRKNKKEIVAIGTWPTPERPAIRPRWILCYLPAPDIMKRVDPYIRKELIFALEKEGIISPEMANIVRINIK